MSRKGFGKFVVGAAIGTGLGLLFAPQKGDKTRKELKTKIDDLLEKAKEIDTEEVKENVIKKIDEIKEGLKNLDKEKAIELAKKEAAELKDKAEDLYKYAVKKGTPLLEKATADIKKEVVKVAKSVVNKLEEK